MPELTDNPRLLDKIREHCLPCFANVPPQEGEFMVTYWIDTKRSMGEEISRATAYRQLDDRVKEGILTVRKGTYNGKQVNVYRFKE